MAYFKDILRLLLLENRTYKKIANDKKSFKRYIFAHFIGFYLFFILLILFVNLRNQSEIIRLINIGLLNKIEILSIFLVFPIITLIVYFIYTLVPFVIGVILGGKPKNYLDFFKVVNYVVPVVVPIALLFPKLLGFILMIWSYFILYKSYKVVHRLETKKAVLAVLINLILYLFLLAIFFFG